jgi:hypothetical protein
MPLPSMQPPRKSEVLTLADPVEANRPTPNNVIHAVLKKFSVELWQLVSLYSN